MRFGPGLGTLLWDVRICLAGMRDFGVDQVPTLRVFPFLDERSSHPNAMQSYLVLLELGKRVAFFCEVLSRWFAEGDDVPCIQSPVLRRVRAEMTSSRRPLTRGRSLY